MNKEYRARGTGDCVRRACLACRTLPHCTCALNQQPWPPAKTRKRARTAPTIAAPAIAAPAPASQAPAPCAYHSPAQIADLFDQE